MTTIYYFIQNIQNGLRAWVFSGYSSSLPHLKNMQTGGRLIGHFKLTIGVNLSVDGWTGVLSRVTPPSPQDTEIGSNHPPDP